MLRCIYCCNEIEPNTYDCPHCGKEIVLKKHRPTEATMQEAKRLLSQPDRPQKREKEPMFSEEAAFMMYIHPDDKTYRDVMRMNILSKDYRKNIGFLIV